MKKLLLVASLAALPLLEACTAVYEPIAMGQGRYSITAQDAMSWTSADAQRSAAAKANEFCVQNHPGTEAVIETIKGSDASTFSYANSQVVFSCQPRK